MVIPQLQDEQDRFSLWNSNLVDELAEMTKKRNDTGLAWSNCTWKLEKAYDENDYLVDQVEEQRALIRKLATHIYSTYRGDTHEIGGWYEETRALLIEAGVDTTIHGASPKPIWTD